MRRIALLLSAVVPLLGYAEHPIDVERRAANGEYLEALAGYDRLPERVRTLATIVAAGRSAWALGLSERAAKEFDRALRSSDLSATLQAELLFSRAAIEFQENRIPSSIFFIEKAAQLSEATPRLAAPLYMLWGDALMRATSYGIAEEKYERAMQSASAEERSEISYRLGLCRVRLGKENAAEDSFQRVALKSERTPESLRHLAVLAIDAERYDDVAFWLEKGRSEFPQSFLDSWTDYALMKVALHKQDQERAKQIYDDAQKKYPPSDPWLVMLNAEVEVGAWQREAP